MFYVEVVWPLDKHYHPQTLNDDKRFWYQTKAHIILLWVVKFLAQLMFSFRCYEQKSGYFPQNLPRIKFTHSSMGQCYAQFCGWYPNHWCDFTQNLDLDYLNNGSQCKVDKMKQIWTPKFKNSTNDLYKWNIYIYNIKFCISSKYMLRYNVKRWDIFHDIFIKDWKWTIQINRTSRKHLNTIMILNECCEILGKYTYVYVITHHDFGSYIQFNLICP